MAEHLDGSAKLDHPSPVKDANLQAEMDDISAKVQAMGQQLKGDSLALLKLLRVLEALHREIREGVFQDALPQSRQNLYSLLRDIEAEGGWPYINRMRLQAFLDQMEQQDAEMDAASGSSPANP